MRTISLFACIVAGCLSLPVRAAEAVAPGLESLAWLVGHWKRTDLPDRRSGYEHWQADRLGYSGTGATLQGAEIVFEEKLRIESDNDGVFYVAKVPGNAAPVRFRLVEQTEKSAAFEDLEHDFPQRISYRVEGNRLESRISGNGREIAFRFERSPPSVIGSALKPTPTRPAMHNMINWFEIPVADFDRAMRFYSAVAGAALEPMDLDGTKMGMLPADGRNVSGAIVQGDGYTPSTEGTLIYLSGGEDLSPMLARVAEAGGSVIVPKTQISPEFGFFALFIDTEGNKIGLHSPK